METNSWPERVLACHIYCDTAHPFIWQSPMTNDTHTCCLAFSSGAVLHVLTTQVCCDEESNTKPSACEANALTDFYSSTCCNYIFIKCRHQNKTLILQQSTTFLILFEGTSYYTVYYHRDTSVYSTNSSYFIGIGLDNGTKAK